MPQGDLGVITAEDMDAIAHRCLTERMYGQLMDGREVDSAYAVPNFGRFRVNMFLALGAVSAKKAGARRYAVVLAALASSIAFMMAFRIMVPAPHHSDVRHIFPVVIPMSVLYAAAVRQLLVLFIGHSHAC